MLSPSEIGFAFVSSIRKVTVHLLKNLNYLPHAPADYRRHSFLSC